MTMTCGTPSRSTVTFACVASPSDWKTCRPWLRSSSTVPLMSVTTSPGWKPSFERRAVAPRIHAESDDLALLHVRGRPDDVRELRGVFADDFAQRSRCAAPAAAAASPSARRAMSREVLRQPQRLEPAAAVEQHAVGVDGMQRRAVRAVDRLADVVGLRSRCGCPR